MEKKVNLFIDKIINFDYLWFLSDIFSKVTFETFLKIVIIYIFILWIAIIIWVTKDIINRTDNIFLQVFSILTVIIWTPLWIVIYLLIRPSKTLFESYYEEWFMDEDIKDFSSELVKQEKLKCFNCNFDINLDYKFCPNCRIKLKKECIQCKKELKPEFVVCPYCWCDQEKKVDKILKNKNLK